MKPQLRRNSIATDLTIEDGCKSDTTKNEDGCSKADAGKNERGQNKVTSFTKSNPTSCLYCAGGHVLEHCFKLGRNTQGETGLPKEERSVSAACAQDI